jgi:hypothetical protein
MTVKETGDRSAWRALNHKNRLAIIGVSIAGIIFGLLIFLLSNN